MSSLEQSGDKSPINIDYKNEITKIFTQTDKSERIAFFKTLTAQERNVVYEMLTQQPRNSPQTINPKKFTHFKEDSIEKIHSKLKSFKNKIDLSASRLQTEKDKQKLYKISLIKKINILFSNLIAKNNFSSEELSQSLTNYLNNYYNRK